MWLLKRINLHASFPKALLRADKLSGGLGLESWVSAVGRSRAELANNLVRHAEPDFRRLAWHLQCASTSRADLSGAVKGWWSSSQRLWQAYHFKPTSWFNTGGSRVNDEPLDRLILQVERGMEESARKAWAQKRSG